MAKMHPDSIEEYIKELLGDLELLRFNLLELVRYFSSCASQINYVIKTRFTRKSAVYIIE